MHTITASSGAGTTNPVAVSEYAASQESRTVYHDLLDGSLGQSWVAPRPRSGTLTLTYTSEADANAARVLHTASPTYLWTTSDRPTLSMTYGVDGSVEVSLDAATGLWTLSVGFQELTP